MAAMSIVSLVYFSQTGSTALLADAVAQGVRAGGIADVKLLRIQPEQFQGGRWSDDSVLSALSGSGTILFGAPTYMGGPTAQFKAFADATVKVWFQRNWKHKLAGGFTISGSPSGDKLHTLSYFNILAAQHGMVWLNWDELSRQPDGTNRFGVFLGLATQNPAPPGVAPVLDPADSLSADKYGRFIAHRTMQLSN